MEAKESVGIIGTGLMGAAMARRLLAQGFKVVVYNRTLVKMLPLRDAGADLAKTAAQVLANTSIALSMLSDGPVSHQVLLADKMNWTGKRLISMATIGVDESRQLGKEIAARGGQYLEAPVLGSILQALGGELMVMAGGKETLFEECLALLQKLASRHCVYVGPLGSASAMKLAFNQLIASLTTAFAASHAFLKKEGVPIDLFMTLLRDSALYAPTFDKKLAMMNSRQFDTANFSLQHMLKDIKLIQESFSSQGIAIQPLLGVQAVVESAMNKGLAMADYSALYEGVYSI